VKREYLLSVGLGHVAALLERGAAGTDVLALRVHSVLQAHHLVDWSLI